MRPVQARLWLRLLIPPLASVAAMAGCAGTATQPAPPTPQVLRVGLLEIPGQDVTSLDPDLVVDRDTDEIDNLLFDGLVTMDASLAVEEWGADQINISPDGLTYTFHLRAGQRFSDGTPVVPSDYAYSINRALDPCTGAFNAAHLFAIKDALAFISETCQDGHHAPAPNQSGPTRSTLIGDSILPHDDAGTLTIILQRPAGYFLPALAYPTAYAMDPALVGLDPHGTRWQAHLTDGPTGSGGSGMYYLAQWDQPGGRLVLKPNPHWWGRAAGMTPRLQTITFTIYAQGVEAISAFDRGAVDITQIDPGAASAAHGDIHHTPLLTTYSLALDWSEPPFDNADARLALCLAVPRSDVAAGLGGVAVPYGSLVPGGLARYRPATGARLAIDMSDQGRNASAARTAWQRYLATLHGAPPPTVLYRFDPTIGHDYGLTAGQAITQAWASVLGVHTALIPLNGDILHDSYSPKPTLFIWTAEYPDPEDLLSFLLLPEALNLSHADAPQADALLRQADASDNPALRFPLYQRAEGLLLDQVALCPVAQGLDTYVVRSGVAGYAETGLGFPANEI